MFLANFLIALREGVEAALIVGVVAAYLVKVGRRNLLPKVWFGVIIAAALPLSLGAIMTWGPYTLSFQAQEILGGTLSLVAVAMVTWMILWMSSNSRQFARKLREDTAAQLASGSEWGVVWIAFIAVAREGIETALFVWATIKSSAENAIAAPALGVVTGLVVAVIIGWLIYTGAARINLSIFFNITGLLLIFVAAGIVSYGIGDLQEASVIPGWGTHIYDITAYLDGSVYSWLTTSSWWWTLLEAMFNVNASPTYLQLIGWLLYIVIILPLFLVRSGMVGAKHLTPKGEQ
ncbi:iron uptake transporter permease EfeU [uncultured Actinomyces sp.]|uniref:iron uptake transporter permease EfeU n=1 Tax=uncultured Actinomyces sp. TaxID=249061 RepID=UPI0015C04803|nr:iron uptake transporter permease EfeU [uncultured Actinomyces sp.]